MNVPDITVGYTLVDKIYKVTVELAKLKLKIQAAKAAIVNKVLNDTKYWKNSKPPSMALIERTYLVTGIDGVDLLSLYKEKEELQAMLDFLKSKLEIYKLEVEIWRTQSANERALN